MTQSAMKENAKANVFGFLEEAITANGGEQVDAYTYAIPTVVNEQEIWVEVKLTSKNWNKTKVSEAYDPFVKQNEYKEIIAEREEKARIAAEKKAKKIAKSKKTED